MAEAPPTEQTCTSCGHPKPIGQFRERRGGGRETGYRKVCRTCESAYDRSRRQTAASTKIPDSPVGDYFKQQWPSVEAFDNSVESEAEDRDIVAPMMMYGTAIERQAMEALLEHGSVAAAAEAMRLTPEQLRAHLSELRRRAAKKGYAPGSEMTLHQPAGFHVKGVSTQVDGEGNVISQWVKTRADEEHKFALMFDALAGLADRWEQRAEPVVAPTATDDDLLCVYPMGDPHLGMFSWWEETGHDFDLAIAQRNLFSAVDHLVNLAPRAKHALIIDLGDFYHADNASNQTMRSHHALDVDTRWRKVLLAGLLTCRRLIDRALDKHEHVTFIPEIGNHDDHSAQMLGIGLAMYYEDEPRVTVDISPAKFHWYRFGKNLLGVTHGDTVKAKDLPNVMACDRAKDWGETLHRYWYTGHVHHDSLKEFPGVIVETFRTLAPADAWHRAAGYRSGQDMKLDVIHREHGRQTRHVVGIRQLFDTARH